MVCAVPWARHRARFTWAFEDQAAWLAVNTSKSAVAELMRIAWRTVGGIYERVCAEAQRDVDLLAGLRRIGIDEISHRKGHHYFTIVVDHDTGRLVWAAAGRDRETAVAKDLKGARFALWKNPENLTARQQTKLSDIQHTNCRLYRAYLLKEQLRQIYRLPAAEAIALLDA